MAESRVSLFTMALYLGQGLEYQVGVRQSQTTDVPGLILVESSRVGWVL